jgi:hypothetical protein
MGKEESSVRDSRTEKENQQAQGLADFESWNVLDEMILNSTLNKYDTVLLARRWAYELKSKDQELRSIQELIPQAVRDILGARVSQKMVRDLPVLRPLLKKQKTPAAALLENIGKSAPNSAAVAESVKTKPEKTSKKKS